jgi:hypothetical protein
VHNFKLGRPSRPGFREELRCLGTRHKAHARLEPEPSVRLAVHCVGASARSVKGGIPGY